VPFRDPRAIAEGVCGFLDDPLACKMCRKAYRMGREMIWPAVARRYLESFQHAAPTARPAPRRFRGLTLASRPYELPPLRLDHVERMSDGTGIIQHAQFNVPNFNEGYCTDDNARDSSCAPAQRAKRPSQADRPIAGHSYLSYMFSAFTPLRDASAIL